MACFCGAAVLGLCYRHLLLVFVMDMRLEDVDFSPPSEASSGSCLSVRPGETLLERLQRLRRRPVSDSSSGVVVVAVKKAPARRIAVMGKPTPRQQLKMERQWAEEKVIHWLQAAKQGNKTQDVGGEESALRPLKRQKVEGDTGTCSQHDVFHDKPD